MTRLEKRVISNFVRECRKYFGVRLVFVGVYGSRVNDRDVNPNSDIDIYIVVANRQIGDLILIRKLRVSFMGVDLTYQFLDELKAKKKGNFRLGHHGDFYLKVLQNIESVYGVNPLSKFNISMISEKRSLLDKIEEYLVRLQDHITISEKLDPILINKYIRKVLVDLLLVRNVVSFEGASVLRKNDVISWCEKAGVLPHLTSRSVGGILLTGNVYPFAKYEKVLQLLWKIYIKAFNEYVE